MRQRNGGSVRQRTISDFFWRDPAICDLGQEDKATLLYFLTSPSSNIIGVYQVVWAIAAAEMGWTKDQMVTVAKRLQLKELIDFNDAGWIWVKIWWDHNSALGAFSPKLLENAKRQCVAMPSEWLEEYLNSLELVGVNRVSIGYQYPNDTPPSNTTSIYTCIDTTTTPAESVGADAFDFEWPEKLSPKEKNSIINIMLQVQFLPFEKQQELIDELAGAIDTNSIKTNFVAFFKSLVDSVQNQSFIPSRGTRVLQARTAMSNKAEYKFQVENLDIEAMKKGAKIISVPAHVQIRLQQAQIKCPELSPAD